LARARARTSLRASRQPPAHHPDVLIGRPHPVELAGPQQLGQGTGIEPVGLGPGLPDPVSLGETTITRATCASRIRAIAYALPGTSSATQSLPSRLCANSSNASGRVWI
jgi:hypothetical protein